MQDAPSTTFLCDKHRSARLKFRKGTLKEPVPLWETRLPHDPPAAVESTPAIDNDGNLYFGCKDGCFYSLDSTGKLRWMFNSRHSIYSSPLLTEDGLLVFASGSGKVYCLTTSGELKWVYNLVTNGSSQRRMAEYLIRVKWHLAIRPSARTLEQMRIASMHSWASPNMDSMGRVFVTGTGIGLHAIDITTGNAAWTYDLGSPRKHLSGVALGLNEEIYVASQQAAAYCLDGDGRLNWKVSLPAGYNAWGNPSFDTEARQAYFPTSRGEADGWVFCLDETGRVRWSTRIQGGIRGSIAIPKSGDAICCSLGGELVFLDRESGGITKTIQVSSAVRALWTTPSIDLDGHVLLSVKDTYTTGRVCCFNANGDELWSIKTKKVLSTPIVDSKSRLYFGTSGGTFACYQT